MKPITPLLGMTGFGRAEGQAGDVAWAWEARSVNGRNLDVKFKLPPGYEAQVRPRSGLALEKGLTCLNSPGTIDSDYRGEVKVILVNLGTVPARIQPGERIAQLVVSPYTRARFEAVPSLSESRRGEGGFGSTGA